MVIICLHIFEGTHTLAHICFTDYEILKLRTLLPSLLVKNRNESDHDIHAIFDQLTAPMPSQLPYQGAILRSPLGGVELPKQSNQLLVGHHWFKPARYYRKPLCGNLFGSSSSEDKDDPEATSIAAKNADDDKEHVAQSGDSSDDADSLSYGLEDTRTTSNMGTHKHMEEIILAGSEEESGAMIPAETVLDSNTEYDWKIQHTGLMTKLEDLTENAAQHTFKAPC